MNTENYTPKTDNQFSGISFGELWSSIQDSIKFVINKWVLILSLILLGGIAGALYATFKRPIYTATTTFVLEAGDNASGLGQYAGLASMVGVDIGGSGGSLFQGDNIIELYKSRSMIQKTLLSPIGEGSGHLLVDSFLEFNKDNGRWKKDSLLTNINFRLNPGQKFSRLQDSILGKVYDDIIENYLSVTKPDEKLSIFKVDVKAENELFAKAFNDHIVKTVNDFYVNTKTKKSAENVYILQRKTDSVRRSMNANIYSAAAIADATPNLNVTRQAQRIAPVQRSQFSAETNKAILGELVKNLELSKISLMKEAPLIQIIDNPIFPLKVKKVGPIKGALLGMILFGLISTLVIFFTKILKNA